MTDDDLGMKLVPASAPIDPDIILTCETLQSVLKDQPPRLTLPIEWAFGDRPQDGLNGPPVTDPVTLYLELPFAADYDDCVYWSCSFEDVIDYLIECHVSWTGEVGNQKPDKIRDAEGRKVCATLAARLRQLADKLDDVCKSDGRADQGLPTFEEG